MGAITKWSVAGVLTLAKVSCAGFFSSKGLGNKTATLMCPIAERLTIGMTAGAEKILFSFFQFNASGGKRCNLRFTHSV